ncbi:hypothetical protein B0J11DRAFT_270515 [Dendryphion nanum]|uniref:Uncharacterized protein n=1 Tax=Dendryphion nanum TaxID=256645 RepID=A0A9P9E031_9PLEO|nr:hypothetical protein B0J11DRAFT_270515 [Dendryphion nanum]
MGILLSLPQRLLNLLLPFTDKSTPLYQDLIHTAILCGTLYFAPQLVDLYNHHTHQHPTRPNDLTNADSTTDDPNTDLPVDHNFVLQPDEDEEPAEPPPLVPTPPPGNAAPAVHFAPQNHPGWENNAENEVDPENNRPRPTHANRVIGPKKAKSLARKDERRAYHEFHRNEAELRRLREAEGKEEREAALAAEKARRAEVEREIQERERAERERKKEEDRRDQEEERTRRERVVDDVRQGIAGKGAVDMVDLAYREGKDRLWVERLVRASGLLSQSAATERHLLITENGWVVRIDDELMKEAYSAAASFGDANKGRVSLQEFGIILEKAVRLRAGA